MSRGSFSCGHGATALVSVEGLTADAGPGTLRPMPWTCARCSYRVASQGATCAECGSIESRFLFDGDSDDLTRAESGQRNAKKKTGCGSRLVGGVVLLAMFALPVGFVIAFSATTHGACWLALPPLILLLFWRPLLGFSRTDTDAPVAGVWMQGSLLHVASFDDDDAGERSLLADLPDDDGDRVVPLEAIVAIGPLVAEGEGAWSMRLTAADDIPVTAETIDWRNRGEFTIRFAARKDEALKAERTLRAMVAERRAIAARIAGEAHLPSVAALRCPRCRASLDATRRCARCDLALPADAITVLIRWRLWPYRRDDVFVVTSDSWFRRGRDYPNHPRKLGDLAAITVHVYGERPPHATSILFFAADDEGKPVSVSFRLRPYAAIAVRTELESRSDGERLAIALESRRRAARTRALAAKQSSTNDRLTQP